MVPRVRAEFTRASLLLSAPVGRDSPVLTFFGAAGIAIAFANSIWLIAAIRRSRKQG